MEGNWVSFFSAALSGGVVVKLVEFGYQSYQSKTDRKRTAKELIDVHLDPLLKAADEIVGKTRSLAERDFQNLIRADKLSDDNEMSTEILGLLYLYAQFWGRIEILKRESIGISIASDERGEILKNFLSCLESQRIRLVDRTHQKAIGELVINSEIADKFKLIGLVEFDLVLTNGKNVRNWTKPVIDVLEGVKRKHIRQKVLVYGVVMHALIDTLDPKHNTTHERPSYPNKLSKNSKADIKYRVFGRYIKEVKNEKKYVG